MKVLPLWCLLPFTIVHPTWAAGAEPRLPPNDARSLDYMIVVTGGELLEGLYPDAHTHFITRTLRPLGGRCVGAMTVDDRREEMQRALRFATNQAPLVIVTGGLGPTPNDITRETLSEFTGIPLREDPDVLGDMERRFNQTKERLRSNLRRQALVPTRSGYLKNPAGTAVGLIFDLGAAVIVALPGPPRELQQMTRSELVPYLQRRFGARRLGCSMTLRFVGVGQSQIDQTIKDHISLPPEITVTSLFEDGRVDFTFSLPGNTPTDQARLSRLGEEVRRHLAEYFYADDGASLEDVVLRKIRTHGGSLVLVEIASGGQFAAALSGADGVEKVLAGAFAAPTAEAMARLLRMQGANSARTGAELAKDLVAAAVSLSGSQWAIAVGPAETDDGGGKRAWVALRLASDTWDTLRVRIPNSDRSAGSAVITPILDRLRRRLE